MQNAFITCFCYRESASWYPEKAEGIGLQLAMQQIICGFTHLQCMPNQAFVYMPSVVSFFMMLVNLMSSTHCVV